MSVKILQALLREFIKDGQITAVEREILQQKAQQLGLSDETLDILIHDELRQNTKQDDNSGFIQTNKSEHKKTASGFLPPADERLSGFIDSDKQRLKNNDLFRQTDLLCQQGAMSMVYKGLRHNKWVAIKRLKAEHRNNKHYQKLFLQEFDNAYHLEHENIVRLIDKGEDEQGLYYYMEYVDGRPLTQLIGKYGIEDEMLAEKILLELLQALDYVHKKQVYHRDLKPDNILITYKGDNVKLIDFGLAMADAYHDELAQAGTPRYAAPEQTTPNGKIDHRTDIYAVGLILQEMLTGHIKAEYRRDINNRLLADLVNKCLRERPADRFQSCSEMIAIVSKVRRNSLSEQRINRLEALRMLAEMDIKPTHDNLLFYCQEGDQTVLELLMAAGLDLNKQDNGEDSPLVISARYNHLKICRLLLEHHVDPNAQGQNKETALMCAIENQNIELIDLLLAYQPDINGRDTEGQDALFRAVTKNKLNIAKQLVNEGANVNTQNKAGQSLLNLAFKQNNTELLTYLLAQGAQTNRQDNKGNTLLIISAQNANTDYLNLLLRYQADPAICNNDGQSALHEAIKTKIPESIRALIGHGAPINHQNKAGESPLHETIKQGDGKLVELLLKNGANTKITDNKANTPLCLAVEKEQEVIVALLLEYGAAVNQPNKVQETPLMLATRYGQSNIAKQLLQAGADPNLHNVNKQTVLDIAREFGHDNIIELLKQYGVKSYHGRLVKLLTGFFLLVASVALLWWLYPRLKPEVKHWFESRQESINQTQKTENKNSIVADSSEQRQQTNQDTENLSHLEAYREPLEDLSLNPPLQVSQLGIYFLNRQDKPVRFINRTLTIRICFAIAAQNNFQKDSINLAVNILEFNGKHLGTPVKTIAYSTNKQDVCFDWPRHNYPLKRKAIYRYEILHDNKLIYEGRFNFE